MALEETGFALYLDWPTEYQGVPIRWNFKMEPGGESTSEAEAERELICRLAMIRGASYWKDWPLWDQRVPNRWNGKHELGFENSGLFALRKEDQRRMRILWNIADILKEYDDDDPPWVIFEGLRDWQPKKYSTWPGCVGLVVIVAGLALIVFGSTIYIQLAGALAIVVALVINKLIS